MKKITLLLVAILLVLSGQKAMSQDLAKAQALFVYSFSKFVDWPESARSGDFVIGVVGSNDVYNEVVNITTGKKLRNMNIVVKKMKSAAELSTCNVLFVADRENSKLESILSFYKNAPTLIVTERQGMINKGSCISLRIEDDKLKYEINKKNIASRGLAADKRLEDMAALVN